MWQANEIIFNEKKYQDTKSMYDEIVSRNFPELRFMKERSAEIIEIQFARAKSSGAFFVPTNLPKSPITINIIGARYYTRHIFATFVVFYSHGRIDVVDECFDYLDLLRKNYSDIIGYDDEHIFKKIYNTINMYFTADGILDTPFRKFEIPERLFGAKFEGEEIDFTFFKNFRRPIMFYFTDGYINFVRRHNSSVQVGWTEKGDENEMKIYVCRAQTANNSENLHLIDITSLKRIERNYVNLPVRHILFRGKNVMEIYYVSKCYAENQYPFVETTGEPELDRILKIPNY